MFEKAPCSSIKEIDVDVLGVLRREGKEKIKNGKLMKVDPVWMKFEVILKYFERVSSLFENEMSDVGKIEKCKIKWNIFLK